MATTICMKRMARERSDLEQSDTDYFVFFEDDNLRQFHAYVIGPEDTLYEHKFVKLKFDIPDAYPLVPPKCKFIQHGGGRIHPNLYHTGKVCLSILGTWPGEPWANAMNTNTVLITIRSILDNEPYRHEPGNRDHPDFNRYVQYSTWTTLLLDYLRKETNADARAFLEKHVSKHATKIQADLEQQRIANLESNSSISPYGGVTIFNYPKLIDDVSTAVDACVKAHRAREKEEEETAPNADDDDNAGGDIISTDVELTSDQTPVSREALATLLERAGIPEPILVEDNVFEVAGNTETVQATRSTRLTDQQQTSSTDVSFHDYVDLTDL